MHERAGRAPGEFSYFDRVRERTPRALRSMSRRLFGVDAALSDEQIKTLASMYYDADPLAEAFVDEVYEGRGRAAGRDMLERAIAEGTGAVEDAPESLVRLFDDIERDPGWLDWDKVERGARVFRRWGTSVFRFAGAITLAAYSESSVAKPLALSGAYAGASAKRRFLETAAFWIAVSEPDGLRPRMPGRASALRVRIMHVFVRQRLRSHPEWDLDAWGVPISQADALLTLMGGSVGPGLALHAMGYLTSREDIEATMHFWRYVGHLMGVRPRFYPKSIAEALQLSFVSFFKRSGRAGQDGVRLCHAYIGAFSPEADSDAPLLRRGRAALEDRLHRGMTQFFLPRAMFRANQLPSAGVWALAPLFLFPAVFAAETLRRTVPGLDDVADRVARRQRERWLEHHLPGRRAEYKPVDKFTR